MISNPYEEIITILHQNDIGTEEIKYVTDLKHSELWNSVKDRLDFDYDTKTNDIVINPDLSVVGENWYLSREYDEIDKIQYTAFHRIPYKMPKGRVEIKL